MKLPQNPHVLLTFGKVHNPSCLPRKTTSKMLRTPQFFPLLTLECASRHNGIHFFDSSTSKSGQRMVCFAHFDLELCFAPQRRYTFSTAQRPKAVREWCVLHILTWKCASRHNGVHFFDSSTSKSGPRMVCFAHIDLEMCFAPQRRALFRHLNFQSGPTLLCFVHFHLDMCFASQRRATFHLSSDDMAHQPPL